MAFIYFKYLMLLLCLVLSVHSERAPSISYISPNVISDIGRQVELTCVALYTHGYSVQWVKYDSEDSKDSLTLSKDSNLDIGDPRFSIEFDEATGAYVLRIQDIRETDDGTYQCKVAKKDIKITAEVEIRVRTPPTIYNSTRSLATGEGESNVLKIASMQKEYRGEYYCVAENGVGRGARRMIYVAVQFAPVVTVRHPRRGQALKNDKYLSCHIDAYPPPAVTWLKDGVKLGITQHYSISNFSTEDDSVDTTILVSAIEEQHYGNYTCKAQNKLGTTEGQVELYETETPECSRVCDDEEDNDEDQTTTTAP